MLNTLIEKYGFAPAARIYTTPQGMTFEILDDRFKEKAGSVYAWCEGEKVHYIGMAGKGIKKRLGEHKSGWKNSATGKRNAEFIQSIGGEIMIYGRVSETYTTTVPIFGKMVEKTYSLCGDEEDFLIETIRPTLNTVGNKAQWKEKA